MGIHPSVANRYLGRWVHCHSVYGLHRGLLTHVLPTGIVLTRCVQLANGPVAVDAVAEAETRLGTAPLREEELAQFFGGFFIPFGGIYGLYPGFGFVI
ncbi:MAG: hypothetical protein IRZ33_03125 [Alicyclobacillaceae bacterium]|nr:hypothetical protein [Alicyclobacillaceae bacterium]